MIQTKDAVTQGAGQSFEIIPVPELLGALGLGLVLSLALRWHFQVFASSFSNRSEFARIFPLLTLTTVLVIGVVKSSLALSLGLVGALSIVRFRTPIKEPEELGYLFLAIAIGLGLGAGLWPQTIWGVLAILFGMAFVQWGWRYRRRSSAFLAVEWAHGGTAERPLDALQRAIGEHVQSNDLRRVDTREDQLEATFYVEFERIGDLSDLLSKLRSACPGAEVTVIDQTRLPNP